MVPENTSIRLHNGTTKYALYPVWILQTKWKGDNYIFAMNGQTGKFVGNLPTDKSAFATMVPGNDGDRWRDRLYYPVSDLGFVGEVNAMKKRISVFLTVDPFMPGMCLSGMGRTPKAGLR